LTILNRYPNKFKAGSLVNVRNRDWVVVQKWLNEETPFPKRDAGEFQYGSSHILMNAARRIGTKER
jgi:hypothetical protein